MNENEPRLTVIGTAHAEKSHWIARAVASITKQVDAPDFELIIVADKATNEARKAASDAVASVSQAT